MSRKKTLGGDRLGTGKKMQVELKAYERSTHNLGYLWRSTMAVGTLVPFLSKVALPGDTWDIELDTSVLTHPTIGPLFGSFKVQLDLFQIPVRLYQAQLHNNKRKVGLDMSKIKLPQVVMKDTIGNLANIPREELDNTQINPSCIFSYLNIRGIGVPPSGRGDVTREFNAIPYLSYWDIYKNYYANQQEENGAVIHAENVSEGDDVTMMILVSPNGDQAIPHAPSSLTNYDLQTTSLKVVFDQAMREGDEERVMFVTNNSSRVKATEIWRDYFE